MSDTLSVDERKRAAGELAASWVESGMVVGLGTGSTAVHAIRAIGARIAAGEVSDVIGIPTSGASEAEARAVGIPLRTLSDHPVIDLTIDGADEIDPMLDMIKGGGGALWREKIVAQASVREVIVVDDSKPSPVLGTRFVLPVEVAQFGWRPEAEYLDDLGATVVVRQTPDGAVFVTDEGNWILDCTFGPIDDPSRLAALIARRAGIVEHGLFLDLATDLLIAGPAGVEHRTRP
ncbi:MAG: ribose-5-phosphate isomerase RpiA [Acidimicrobiia bacterium]